MNYSIMNENLRGICFPIVVTLMNLANINARSTKKIIIRLGTFFYGLIGGFLIYNAKTMPNEIRLQTIFEWVMLFSVGYYPFFECFLGKLYKSSNKKFEKKHGLNYTKEEIANSELITDDITSFVNLIMGVIILFITVSPIFTRIISKSSCLYHLSMYNYIISALSCFGLFLKKRSQKQL